jgi:hypothetical protein
MRKKTVSNNSANNKILLLSFLFYQVIPCSGHGLFVVARVLEGTQV